MVLLLSFDRINIYWILDHILTNQGRRLLWMTWVILFLTDGMFASMCAICCWLYMQPNLGFSSCFGIPEIFWQFKTWPRYYCLHLKLCRHGFAISLHKHRYWFTLLAFDTWAHHACNCLFHRHIDSFRKWFFYPPSFYFCTCAECHCRPLNFLHCNS